MARGDEPSGGDVQAADSPNNDSNTTTEYKNGLPWRDALSRPSGSSQGVVTLAAFPDRYQQVSVNAAGLVVFMQPIWRTTCVFCGFGDLQKWKLPTYIVGNVRADRLPRNRSTGRKVAWRGP